MYALLELLRGFIFFMLRIESTNKFPRPLTKKEEAEALIKRDAGDKAARNLLIEHNLRLVMHIVKKYYTDENSRDDLISIGTLGLIKAIDSFNPSKGTRLATYASRCIENEILMHFRSIKKTARDVSMSDAIETDNQGNPLTLADVIATDDTIAEDIDSRAKCKKVIELVMGIKNQRDRDILIHRYGLFGNENKTQQETADLLGISRSYVSRIETRLLKMLREEIEKDKCI